MKKLRYFLALPMTVSLLVGCSAFGPGSSQSEETGDKDPGTSVSGSFAYSCQEDLSAVEEDEGFLRLASWEIGPLSFPVLYSATAGGCQVLGSGARAGFAHSSDGAAAAALNAVAGYDPGYSRQQLDEIEAKVADIPGIEHTRVGAQQTVAQGQKFVTVDDVNVFAYRMEAYTIDEALYRVFVRDRKSNKIAAFTVPLIWDGGDWKVIPTGDEKNYYLEVSEHQGALGEVTVLPVITADQVEK